MTTARAGPAGAAACPCGFWEPWPGCLWSPWLPPPCLVFSTVRNVVANWQVTRQGGGPTQVAAAITPATPAPGVEATPTAGPSPTPIPTVAVKTWTGTERVTILVLGIDRRVGENEKGYLTDTMMLVTIDPQTRTAAMLSIPRDLWVEVPGGFDVDTINTANRTGDYYDYPGGGPALAVKTVEHNLGVNVNYYVRLDFTAFETFIDTIGGIDIYNQTDIDDPEYPNGSYGYEPFTLSAGAHHLNGHDALRYARTRHSGQGDIDRARRQQEVVMAVRERVLNLNMLPTLIAQAPLLYQTLNQSVWTDMSLKQMVSLALLAQSIPRENIKSAVIDYRYVTEGTSPTGRQVLIPLRDKIRELRDELFSTSTVAQPLPGQDDAALMQAEAARLEVLNGAGVEGLALRHPGLARRPGPERRQLRRCRPAGLHQLGHRRLHRQALHRQLAQARLRRLHHHQRHRPQQPGRHQSHRRRRLDRPRHRRGAVKTSRP